MTTQTQPTPSTKPTSNPLLRNAIRGNSLFCGLSGAVILTLAPAIGRTLGIANANALGSITGVPFLQGLGALLVVYAAALYWLTRQPAIPDALATGVIALDIGWVALSGWVILGNIWPLTPAGVVIVDVLAVIVGVFAAVQAWGLYRRA